MTHGVTAVLGVLILVATLTCNNWVIKAQTVFSNFERVNLAFGGIDRTDLVVMVDLCNQRNKELTPTELARFVQVYSTIQTNGAIWNHTRSSAQDLLNSLDIALLVNSTWARVTSVFRKSESTPGGDEIKNQQISFLAPQSSVADICKELLDDPSDLIRNYKVYQASLNGAFADTSIWGIDLMLTGAGPGTIEVAQQQLRDQMAIITRWWLPILYGSVGAILFCLTKLIRDKSNAPKLAEVFLRLIFGGFAGFVVSALLIPSGVVPNSIAGSAPGASFLAFIFGYSLDSFVSILERLNQLVMESTALKSSKSKKEQ